MHHFQGRGKDCHCDLHCLRNDAPAGQKPKGQSRFSLSIEIEILATMLLPWDDPHEVADVHGIRRGDQRNDIEVVLIAELSDDVVVSVSEGLVGRVW